MPPNGSVASLARTRAGNCLCCGAIFMARTFFHFGASVNPIMKKNYQSVHADARSGRFSGFCSQVQQRRTGICRTGDFLIDGNSPEIPTEIETVSDLAAASFCKDVPPGLMTVRAKAPAANKPSA